MTREEKITVTPEVMIESRFPADQASPRCVEYACTSAAISAYPAETTSERNRFWSQAPPAAMVAGNVSPTPGIGTM